MRDHRRLEYFICRTVLFAAASAYVFSCTPKLASTTASEDFVEDVSDYRPSLEIDEAAAEEPATKEVVKGPYVAPANDINREMSVIMDSIIIHNRENSYLTYTVQVYIGRSREEANQVREKVYRVFPEEEPSLTYRQPSYKVNVGRFFDRVEAYKALTTLRQNFPSAILVPERNQMAEDSP